MIAYNHKSPEWKRYMLRNPIDIRRFHLAVERKNVDGLRFTAFKSNSMKFDKKYLIATTLRVCFMRQRFKKLINSVNPAVFTFFASANND